VGVAGQWPISVMRAHTLYAQQGVALPLPPRPVPRRLRSPLLLKRDARHARTHVAICAR